ncbi:MAG: cytochrome c biogenesis protein CcsA [Nitrospinaceae bacterium]|jgi:cytochrome c-type biogenesis protein CcsB|nr:cytochrome c biogenesis protein CcsA [Nitrospina sp.]MBT5376333.1 cytochrome c biogenesis protein CcsA [Nitrospinaceae bacterium]MBT5868368.1 cytochrome c biogenesis protein CcsA [Nitrospinaceae bacterium]MBT6346318.1 cytochrome c biogenesis protein CcsA [Nitrospina sp.]
MDKISFNLSLFSYLVASVGYFIYLAYRRPLVSTCAGWAVAFGLFCQTVTIGIRSSQTGHGPYTTSFEVALFLAWLMVVVYFLTEWKYKIKDLGAFVIPLVFIVLLFSAFLSKETVLVPESEVRFWLTMHRTLSIMGYAAFSIAFAAGIMYLIQEHQVKTKKLGIMYFRMPSLEVLDDLNFKVIMIGFPLFTLGFMTGSIWNIQMEQPFFSWDLMRTLPLVIVWLIYGLVFFGRMITGLRGKKAAQGAILGFITVVGAYFLHII